MEDILEPVDTQQRKFRSLFSVLSFSFAMSTIIIFLVFVTITVKLRTAETLPSTIRVIVKVLLINMLAGLVFAVASLVRKEKLKYYKAIGAVVNILAFLLVFGSAIFSLIMDNRRAAHTTQQPSPLKH